jgi:aerobic-type carbon monoxide dehydrogenase small subunit (CoxS/CutS family)
MTGSRTIALTVNGQPRRATVEMRTTLVDLLREELRMTGRPRDVGACIR